MVIIRAKEVYRTWHNHLININKTDRNTLGMKIDLYFLDILEILFRASFTHDKFEKLSLVSQGIGKVDLLKFFLQIGWEQKIIDHTLYAKLIVLLDEIGRMSGGWKKNIQEKTPRS